MKKIVFVFIIMIVFVALISCENEMINIKSLENDELFGGTLTILDKDEFVVESIELGEGSLSNIKDLLPKVNFQYISSKRVDDHYDVFYVFYETDGKVYLQGYLIDNNSDYTEIYLSDKSEVVIALSDFYFDYDWYIEDTVNFNDSFKPIEQKLNKVNKSVDGGLPYKEILIKVKKETFTNNGVHLKYKSNTKDNIIFNIFLKLQ